ncbi:ATP-NAD kinase family protein [Paraglaciecola hydrolytica]|uniref:ATP-NAD kinase n=1 Tax=Paraglaciecola hydrolytica TaxID=1799789 RepID=A0A136A2K2_9ALTE|nr:ATP-NAD kinase family protein [Paraglaciecola hydrolytica]KXI29427.1 ATP-NAD kinase [Paraglaciecola hydrolytica]
MSDKPFTLGLIINPYAGIGGALALKGSDGAEIRSKALALGAQKKAADKTRLALDEISQLKDKVHILTAAGEMGEDLAKAMGFTYTLVYQSNNIQTEGSDTEATAKALLAQHVDLVLFAGGDGTARNICHVIDQHIPVLGVPAGCKIHSGVYAITPQAAGRVLSQVIQGQIVSLNQADVMDIDEDLFRQGRVNARQYGEMQVPTELRYIQAVKMGGKESDELVLTDIAAHIIDIMAEHPQHYFIMGSGSTVDFVMQELGLANTLLGVDLVKDRQLIASDLTADTLLDYVKNQATKLVITLIGGQGHIFGRGNQQLSPAVLRFVGKENILLIATKNKLNSLAGKALVSDSGDMQLDRELAGLMPVITGYRDQVLYPLADLENLPSKQLS